MTIVSDIQLAVLKTSAIVLIAAAVAVLVSVAYNNHANHANFVATTFMRSPLEGMENAGDVGADPG